ncbi:MAG: glycosyltransferase family 9 protein, partial [Candidatus Omnitrophota bacterium]
MKKFLIINPFGIGDVLFTTPLIRAIRDFIPDALIGYWCNQRVKDLFINNPQINKVFAFSRGDLKKIYQGSWFEGLKHSMGLFLAIRKERFDCAIDFSLDHRYGLTSKLAGIKKRIGFNYKNRGVFLTEKVALDSYRDKHIVEYYLELLKPLGLEAKNKFMELPVSETGRAKCRAIFKANAIKDGELVVGIAPGAGASWGRDAALKHWPELNFAQLAQRLMQELGARVLILGDESERP